MKRILSMVAGVVLVGVVSAQADGPVAAGTAPAAPAKAATEVKAVKLQTVCPIQKGAINKSLFVDYDGKRIYVCCSGCIAPLQKDPAKYVKQMEAEGITLEKVPVAVKPPAPSNT